MVNRKKVKRPLQLMGISTLYPKANTSRPGKGHRISPLPAERHEHREAKPGMGNYFRFYNRERRHQSLDRQTPDQVYEWSEMWPVAA